jgi:hypothetical protein
MAAHPPERSRTAEIDLHDIIPATEVEARSALEPASSDQGEFLPVASSGNKIFHTYDALRIGRSGWANVLFAALTVFGGILCTVHFFNSPELRRWALAHRGEDLYQRSAGVASGGSAGDRIRTYSSGAATGPGNASVSGGGSPGSNSQGPQLPPGSPQLPNPPANSAGSDTASRSRSSGSAESRSRNAIASRSRQSRNVRSPRVAHSGKKLPNRSLHASMRGSGKSASRTLSARNHLNQMGAGRSSSSAINKAGGGTLAAARSMPSAMKSGATVFRGSALNLAGLGRETATREAVRRERGAMHRR